MILAVNGEPVDDHGTTISLMNSAQQGLELLCVPGSDDGGGIAERMRRLHLAQRLARLDHLEAKERPLDEFEA